MRKRFVSFIVVAALVCGFGYHAPVRADIVYEYNYDYYTGCGGTLANVGNYTIMCNGGHYSYGTQDGDWLVYQVMRCSDQYVYPAVYYHKVNGQWQVVSASEFGSC